MVTYFLNLKASVLMENKIREKRSYSEIKSE